MANVLWLQGGACSGNTISFLNAEEPTVCDLISDFGINLLWHPSLGLELGDNLQQLLGNCISGATPLDIKDATVYLIEAENLGFGWEPSPVVRQAGDRVVAEIIELIDNCQLSIVNS